MSLKDHEVAESVGEEERRRTPPPGYTRGPHPPSPAADTVLHLLADLPTTGHLAATATGLLYVDLEDAWVTSLQEEMARWAGGRRGCRFGYQLPPYFYPAAPLGAHITLLPPLPRGQEREGVVEVLGEQVEFEVVGAGPQFPIRYWYGTEAVYRVWVRGEQLTRVATSLGGTSYRPPRSLPPTILPVPTPPLPPPSPGGSAWWWGCAPWTPGTPCSPRGEVTEPQAIQIYIVLFLLP